VVYYKTVMLKVRLGKVASLAWSATSRPPGVQVPRDAPGSVFETLEVRREVVFHTCGETSGSFLYLPHTRAMAGSSSFSQVQCTVVASGENARLSCYGQRFFYVACYPYFFESAAYAIR